MFFLIGRLLDFKCLEIEIISFYNNLFFLPLKETFELLYIILNALHAYIQHHMLFICHICIAF